LSVTNKIKNKIQQLIGKAKAKVGEITGNRSLQVHGKSQQARADIKRIAEKAKDVFKT
jgi:uncharacterized protein YjbJ (UPF0337 family)